MMGSGKSAVGKVISSNIDVPFKDVDFEIEQAANCRYQKFLNVMVKKFFEKRKIKSSNGYYVKNAVF